MMNDSYLFVMASIFLVVLLYLAITNNKPNPQIEGLNSKEIYRYQDRFGPNVGDIPSNGYDNTPLSNIVTSEYGNCSCNWGSNMR